MKTPPAFDALDLSTGENEEFGDESVGYRHFTEFSYENSHAPSVQMADSKIVALMNPISHDKVLIHASQVPYDIIDMLKKKGYEL